MNECIMLFNYANDVQMIDTMTRTRHRPATHRKSVSCSEHVEGMVEGIVDLEEGGTYNQHEQWQFVFIKILRKFPMVFYNVITSFALFFICRYPCQQSFDLP